MKRLFAAIISSVFIMINPLPALATDFLISGDPTWYSPHLWTSKITDHSVKLTWSGATDDEGISDYKIYKNGSLLRSVSSSTTSYTMTGLSSNTYYTFKIQAGDNDENWSTNGPSSSVRTLKNYYYDDDDNDDYDYDSDDPYWSNERLKASEITENEVALEWSGAWDDKRVTKYRLYKDDDFETTIYSDSHHYSVDNLQPNTVYNFRVEAGDSDNNWSSDGPNLTVRTLAEKDKLPSEPTPNDIEIIKFTDIKGHWAEADILYMYKKGIVEGISKDVFAPEKYITKAEFCAMLISALGLKTVCADTVFSDVKKESWYAGIITTAYKNHLISGFDNKFFPDKIISREEISSMLINIKSDKNLKVEYQTTGNTTRAEAVVIIKRLMEKI